MAAQRLSRQHKRILQWLAADYQRTRGMITSSRQDLVRALPGDKGNISHSLQTLEARGLIAISRSSHPFSRFSSHFRSARGGAERGAIYSDIMRYNSF
jgi:hypothetical protein